MSHRRLETLAWVLIYGGLLVLCLGLFVDRTGSTLGWTLQVGGALGALAGVVLIWLRSRRGP
jgi:F0F1-type ATP synthase assembly protein I